MKKMLLLDKPLGMTPLQAIQAFKQIHKAYRDSTISYAGRLDPMAQGLLLLLVGEENKRRRLYEDLRKEYVCEVLFGLATDSYDLLGKITAVSTPPIFEKHTIEKYLSKHTGKQVQVYPPYSSKPVQGKPLYYWARHNRLQEIALPTRTVEIFHIELMNTTRVQKQMLYKDIIKRIEQVHGDFRQIEILEQWNTFFQTTKEDSFLLCTLRVTCSSGTYIRSLANKIGIDLQITSLAFSITRTQIGAYSLADALSI